jgi:tripartite ATP-independent transporter DctP family solute receptor
MKFRRSVTGAAVAAAVLALVPAAQAQSATLRMHGVYAAEDTSSRAMEIFKAEAERLSGGTLAFELIPDKPGAGGAREVIDEVRTQGAFGTWIGAPGFSRLVPEIGALNLPFVFDNYDQVARALEGPVGATIEAKLAAKGFTVLGWMQWGPRHVMNSKRPLRTLGDFKDLKVRVQPNETFLATFRALGANPMALDLKDIHAALRQGDVDSYEGPYLTIYDYKFYEHQKYISDSAHVLDLIVVIANRNMFMSLQPREQKAIREAAAIACAREWKMVAAEDAAALVKLQEKGLQFDPLMPGARAALKQATAVVVEDARKRFGDDLVNSILASAGAGKTH